MSLLRSPQAGRALRDALADEIDVAAQIMRDPDQLALSGEKRQIYAMFTDLEGFTKLSHAITPEQLSELLNRYLDVLSDTVLMAAAPRTNPDSWRDPESARPRRSRDEVRPD